MSGPENGQATASNPKEDAEVDNTPKLVLAVTANKRPPAETSESLWLRRNVLMSFWLVVLLVGIPFWWQTTTVYRASLPYDIMDSWAAGTACEYRMPLRVALEGSPSQTTALESLQDSVQAAFDSSNGIAAHQIQLIRADEKDRSRPPSTLSVKMRDRSQSHDKSPMTNDPTIRLAQRDNAQASELVVEYPSRMLENDEDRKSKLAPLITNELHAVFAEERAMIARLEQSRKSQAQTSFEVLAKGREDEIERRQQRSMKYASTYHLTFSLLTLEASPTDWDIEAVLAQTMKPLLKALSPISNFTIDTQVQPYAQFSDSVQPVYKDERKVWELKSSDLGGFINAAEWPLSPSIGAGPTINFLLYVPAASQPPLMIEGSDSASWLVLQWGGIAIHNPLNPDIMAKTGTLTVEELREPFLTFSQHLLDLLGLPSPDLPFQLRLQSQTRILAVRLLSSASSTLGSLARLTQTLTSISIPDTVATSVDRTIFHLQSTCAALNAGDFQSALDNAKTADEEAEKAFFHKSMVGQVYFPDEHKVAVYLPLLGPVAVPLIMTAIKELKAWAESRRRGGV